MLGLTQDQIIVIVSALFAVSEALSLIPSIKANGIFQVVFNIIKAIKNKLS